MLTLDIWVDVFSNLPLGTSKIAMLIVCRTFYAALHSSAAHSLKTFDEDEFVNINTSHDLLKVIRT